VALKRKLKLSRTARNPAMISHMNRPGALKSAALPLNGDSGRRGAGDTRGICRRPGAGLRGPGKLADGSCRITRRCRIPKRWPPILIACGGPAFPAADRLQAFPAAGRLQAIPVPKAVTESRPARLSPSQQARPTSAAFPAPFLVPDRTPAPAPVPACVYPVTGTAHHVFRGNAEIKTAGPPSKKDRPYLYYSLT
jgi:hypothetical protein